MLWWCNNSNTYTNSSWWDLRGFLTFPTVYHQRSRHKEFGVMITHPSSSCSRVAVYVSSPMFLKNYYCKIKWMGELFIQCNRLNYYSCDDVGFGESELWMLRSVVDSMDDNYVRKAISNRLPSAWFPADHYLLFDFPGQIELFFPIWAYLIRRVVVCFAVQTFLHEVCLGGGSKVL